MKHARYDRRASELTLTPTTLPHILNKQLARDERGPFHAPIVLPSRRTVRTRYAIRFGPLGSEKLVISIC
jgi:hypothetical protein